VHGDLRLIATAKVEATYAGRPVSGSIVDQLTRAYRRVRVGLLRLLFRREGRAWLPRGPRGPREASPSDWSGHSG